MAQIIWNTSSSLLLEKYIDNALVEFGKTTAIRWAEAVAAFEYRVSRHPTSYPTEELLHDREFLFRRCHIMNRRFKIIYYYDKAKDTVHVVDIWDSKMNPKTLTRRIQ